MLAGRLPAGPGPPARLIALTFDDGPYPVTTPLLVQTLRELGVPATFFLIGRDAEQFPALVRAIAAGGNEIADHTLTHPDLDRLDDGAVRAELEAGAAALERILPDPAVRRLFRPPHGRYRWLRSARHRRPASTPCCGTTTRATGGGRRDRARGAPAAPRDRAGSRPAPQRPGGDDPAAARPGRPLPGCRLHFLTAARCCGGSRRPSSAHPAKTALAPAALRSGNPR